GSRTRSPRLVGKPLRSSGSPRSSHLLLDLNLGSGSTLPASRATSKGVTDDERAPDRLLTRGGGPRGALGADSGNRLRCPSRSGERRQRSPPALSCRRRCPSAARVGRRRRGRVLPIPRHRPRERRWGARPLDRRSARRRGRSERLIAFSDSRQLRLPIYLLVGG